MIMAKEKFEITRPGANGPKGAHEVGDVLEIDPENIPGYLIGKGRLVKDTPESGEKAAEIADLKGQLAEKEKTIEAMQGLIDGHKAEIADLTKPAPKTALTGQKPAKAEGK